MKDPAECCQLAGVQAPASVLQHAGSIDSNSSPDNCEDFSNRPEIMVRSEPALNNPQNIFSPILHVVRNLFSSYQQLGTTDNDVLQTCLL